MGNSDGPIIMDGRKLAGAIQARLKKETLVLREKGIIPGLATILVGDDAPSATYIAMKHRTCQQIGIRSIHTHFPATTTQEDLVRAISQLNENSEVDAILMQIPLPKDLDEHEALFAVAPEKDADGLNPINLGKLVIGKPGPLPCTPNGILTLLIHYGVPIEGKRVVIVGRGLTIGRPLALLMSMKIPNCNAAVTVLHSAVTDITSQLREADIIVAAAGSPGLIKKNMVKPGAAVIAAGITRNGKNILSDVEEDVAEVAGWITPRIGGVGPMTVAMLMENTVFASQRRA